MEHSLRMTVQISDFGTVRVFPKAKLVVAESVGAENLFLVFVPFVFIIKRKRPAKWQASISSGH